MNRIKTLNHTFHIGLILTMCISSLYAGRRDRSFATHNVNQVGFFTTNIGQFYPYDESYKSTMEYPINSGHISIYRQCLMIGVPVNVVSAADGNYEEFDAIGGFHNQPGIDMAVSDNPATWPSWGWPVQDSLGNPIFVSQQESFCVYSDSTNWQYVNSNVDNPELRDPDLLLGIQVYQTIYSWGVEGTEKFHILKFEIENTKTTPLEDVYFNFYSDLDIGGRNNEEREWADDCIEFDKSRELIYFYDSDNYSNEWGEANPFLTGVTFLKTPNNQGITDWHWIDVYVDEVAVDNAEWDSVSYYLMRSDTTWFHNNNDRFPVSDYFHLGDNPINGTHYDDPATTRITDAGGNLVGGAMVAYICNGPFTIQPGERAEVIVGVMVGDDEADILNVTDAIWDYYRDDFNIPIIPQPRITDYVVADRRVEIFWDNDLDINYINQFVNPPANDLEGYIIYRATDQSLQTWTVRDTIQMQYLGQDSTAFNDMAYIYIDSIGVYNGFDYFYGVVAYRYDEFGNIQKSGLLKSLENIDNQNNTIRVEPQTRPAVVSGDLDDIKVVPNPFIISANWDEERLGNYAYGEPVRNLAFTHLPSPCTIKIFTLDGDLVRTLEHTRDSGRLEWNLLTSENRPIVSGIYFYHVKSALGEKVGRFAVIR